MTLIGILHALGSRSAILSLALAPWLLTIGCDHGARPSGRAEERRDVGDGTPGAQSQPLGGAHDTLPEDTIGFEFAVYRRGNGDVTLAEYVGVLRRHLKGEPFFEVVRITAEDDRAVRIWVKPLTRDYAEIDEFLRGIVQPRALEFRILAYRSAEDPGKRVNENPPDPEGAGHRAGVLSAGATEGDQDVIAGVQASLDGNPFDGRGHVGVGDVGESLGDLVVLHTAAGVSMNPIGEFIKSSSNRV